MSAVNKINELNRQLLESIDKKGILDHELSVYHSRLMEIIKGEYMAELGNAVEEYVNRVMSNIWNEAKKECRGVLCMCKKLNSLKELLEEMEEVLYEEIEHWHES
ncbi:MAG: hypothetical protein C0179_01580 [Fervidicoccus sp.]|nr:MAG: hypothetical protein C0179_01580 [Fervidicoccus sp.]